MRTSLLAAAAATAAAVVMLTGCGKSADKQATNAAAPKNAQVLPITDDHAMVVATPATEAMLRSMRAAPLAHDAALQRMHERHEGMERIGKSFKAAGRTLKSASPEIAVIRSSAATIARLAALTPTWFPAGTGPDVGKTGAKPEIWQKPADFVAKDKALQQAAIAFDATARSGNMAAVQARFGDLGKTCKACHDSYRSEMHH